MNKKNLDKLFNERFRDFDEIPDEKVWNAIEASLEKKKSRKVIPIWWKLGGVAAVLAIVFYLVDPFENSISKDSIEITDTKNENTINQENNFNQLEKLEENQQSNTGFVEEETETETDNKSGPVEHNSSYANSSNSTDTSQKSKVKTAKSQTDKLKRQVSNTVNTAIAHQDKKEFLMSNANSEKQYENSSDAIALLEKQEAITKNILDKERSKTLSDAKEVMAQTDVNNLSSENTLGVNTKEEKAPDVTSIEEKKSIFDEITKKEEEVVVENKSNKWSVGPSVAPVYFNGIGEGSPIDAAFTPNSKSGDVNLSYGVSVAYEVSKKLKVRSGVYKVDYGYHTNDIAFTSSFSPTATAQIKNINYTNTSKSILVESIVSNERKLQSPSFANDFSAKSPALEGSLSQQFGYIELPLELNYTVLDKRFGVNVIGGVSSLFLINNDIFLNSGDQTTEMGEANNLNEVNFSTNFGFGINYKFTPKLHFNVEPVFKYQLNTFSNTAGAFQPFSVGVYSGVRFKF